MDLQGDLLEPDTYDNIADPHLLVIGKENHPMADDMKPELFK
jgi:hypothetical protein